MAGLTIFWYHARDDPNNRQIINGLKGGITNEVSSRSQM